VGKVPHHPRKAVEGEISLDVLFLTFHD
jgi:hypothetical protein